MSWIWEQLGALWREDEEGAELLDFDRWANQRQIALLIAISVLVVVLNPPFHVILRQLPGIEPERLSLRVIPMIVALLCLWGVRVPYLYERSRWMMFGLMTVQMCCSLLHVVEASNHALYVAAALTPLYASQLPFMYTRDLCVSLVVSYVWYMGWMLWLIKGWGSQDVLGLMLVGCAGLVSVLLGSIRIRALNHEYKAREALAHKSVELQRAEQRALALAREAQEANEAKSSFMANMSHELRTPLNAVIGYAELIEEDVRDGVSGEALVPDVQRIQSAAHHLLYLMNDILDLSKVEAGRMEVITERFMLRELVEEVGEMGVVLAEQRGNALRVVCGEGVEGVEVVMDRVKLKQIVLNLLSNAAKFTDRGEIGLEVGVEGDGVSVVVRDTGAGMDEEQLARLFQPFVQVHDASQRGRYGGTGLGLVLSKRLAELMGGSLSVESAQGVGSTFRLVLPYGAAG